MILSTITPIYRAEVQVPSEVFERVGHSAAYSLRSSQISAESGVAASGQSAYSTVYVWGEDSSLHCATKFQTLWEEYITHLLAGGQP